MKKLFKNFTIVLIMIVLAKIASFVSEIIVAYLLGTSQKADAYSMVLGIHQVIFPMVNIGIWSIFLPMYKKELMINKDMANTFANKIICLFFLVSLIIVLLLNLFASPIIIALGNGFPKEVQSMCVILLRIHSPYYIFVIISAIYAAILQSNEKFFGSQIRELVTYLPTIILGPFLYKYFNVYGLIFALVIGSILRLFIMFIFFDKSYKFNFDFDFKTKEIHNMLKKMPSVLVTSSIEQINTLVDKVMATYLVIGSVASLSYGHKLINVFNGLFTAAISTTLYPTLTQYVLEKKYDKLKKIVTDILIVISIIIIPLSVLAILLRYEIVTLVFARGEFNINSVKLTSLTFMGYLFGMYYIGTKPFTNNVFYSFGETKKTMKMSIVTISINLLLNFVLTHFFGVTGLAIATSISCVIYYVLSTIMLNKLKCIDCKNVYSNLLKIYLISIISYVICYEIKENIGISNYLVKGLFITFIYLIIYFVQFIIVCSKEKKVLISYFKRIVNIKSNKKHI